MNNAALIRDWPRYASGEHYSPCTLLGVLADGMADLYHGRLFHQHRRYRDTRAPRVDMIRERQAARRLLKRGVKWPDVGYLRPLLNLSDIDREVKLLPPGEQRLFLPPPWENVGMVFSCPECGKGCRYQVRARATLLEWQSTCTHCGAYVYRIGKRMYKRGVLWLAYKLPVNPPREYERPDYSDLPLFAQDLEA